MKRLTLVLSLLGALMVAEAVGQSGAIVPEHGAGHATDSTCVILKRMGPADEVTSHLYSFGIRGKQFQYVEGKLPDGFPFHGRLTDHDVRNLQSRGTEVLVLESHYTSEDLKQARTDCKGQTGKTPKQPEAKTTPSPMPAENASPSAAVHDGPAGAALGSASNGKLSIVSIPQGADISIDGSFVGNTPSDLQLAEGEHIVSVKKSGFKEWERKMRVSGGSSVHLNAELEKGVGQ